jgi:hypothetical protein
MKPHKLARTVIQYDNYGRLLNEFSGLMEAVEQTGMRRSTLVRVLNRKNGYYIPLNCWFRWG